MYLHAAEESNSLIGVFRRSSADAWQRDVCRALANDRRVRPDFQCDHSETSLCAAARRCWVNHLKNQSVIATEEFSERDLEDSLLLESSVDVAVRHMLRESPRVDVNILHSNILSQAQETYTKQIDWKNRMSYADGTLSPNVNDRAGKGKRREIFPNDERKKDKRTSYEENWRKAWPTRIDGRRAANLEAITREASELAPILDRVRCEASEEAFSEIFSLCSPFVSKIAKSIAQPPMDPADIEQQVWMNVWKYRLSLSPDRGAFFAFLRKITLRQVRPAMERPHEDVDDVGAWDSAANTAEFFLGILFDGDRSSSPESVLSFAFRDLLDWTPREIVTEHANTTFDELMNAFLADYANVSGVEGSKLRKISAPFLALLASSPVQVGGDKRKESQSSDSIPQAQSRQVGGTPFRGTIGKLDETKVKSWADTAKRKIQRKVLRILHPETHLRAALGIKAHPHHKITYIFAHFIHYQVRRIAEMQNLPMLELLDRFTTEFKQVSAETLNAICAPMRGILGSPQGAETLRSCADREAPWSPIEEIRHWPESVSEDLKIGNQKGVLPMDGSANNQASVLAKALDKLDDGKTPPHRFIVFLLHTSLSYDLTTIAAEERPLGVLVVEIVDHLQKTGHESKPLKNLQERFGNSGMLLAECAAIERMERCVEKWNAHVKNALLWHVYSES